MKLVTLTKEELAEAVEGQRVLREEMGLGEA